MRLIHGLLSALLSSVIIPQAPAAQAHGCDQPPCAPLYKAREDASGQPGKHTQQQPRDKPEETKDDAVVRVNTRLVTLPVSAVDISGRYITDLIKEDFRIYEDGVEQPAAFFAAAEQPVLVVLVLDVSQSTIFQTKRMKAAAISFLDQLKPNDYVYVVAFAMGAAPLHKQATNDRKELTAAILSIRHGGFTALYDTVQEVSDKILKRARGRKAMILFSDGRDNMSHRANKRGTLKDAEELDALIYTVQHSSIADSQYLKALAEKTGGRYFKGDNEERLKETFAQIGEELRRQYILGYYTDPTAPAGRRRNLRVRVRRQGVKVILRKTSIDL